MVRTYRVVKGDTLWSIARRFGTTVAELRRLNGLTGDLLRIGRILKLPEAPAPAPGRVPSPVPGYEVTYPYGVPDPRYAAGYHTGEDYAAPSGTPVVAVRAGLVVWSNDNGGAYGKWLGLQADNDRVYVYCHLAARHTSTGTRAEPGRRLGTVGATGNTTGPHLHFEDHPKGPFRYAKGREPRW